MWASAMRMRQHIRTGQRPIILHFGDHDPSGLDMIRDIYQRLEFMLVNGVHGDLFGDVDSWFSVLPIGLSMEQIKKYDLPPNPTKLTDSRAKKYIQKFGKTCWEVDALSPKTLTSIVETNIKKIINQKQFDIMLVEENEGKKELQKFIDSRD